MEFVVSNNTATTWPQPPSVPELNANDVQVWHIHIEDFSDSDDDLTTLLAREEQDRAQRMRVQEKKREYIIGRLALRSILSAYSGTPCDQLSFDYGPQKKPSLAEQETLPPERRLDFNLSHSGRIILIAVTLGKRIGIDVEYIEPDRADEKIAQRYFSPTEFTTLKNLPDEDRIAGFYRCWTSKEAFVKARGDGLTFPLDAFDVAISNEERAILEIRDTNEDAARWELKAIEVGDKYAATCAVEGKQLQWSQWSWPDDGKGHAPA